MAYRFHELVCLDDAVAGLVPLAALRRAASLCALSDAALVAVKAAAEGLVLELLGWPADSSGSRSVARASYRETFVVDAPAPVVDLARRPASVTAVRLDGALADAAAYRVMESTGRIVWRAAWPAPGVEIAVDYAGGWRTAAQGAGEGPALPAALAESVLRAAQIIGESAGRSEGVTLARFDESIEGGGAWAQSWRSGRATIEDEVRSLLAPFSAMA